MRKLYFVRHGESLWNIEHRICGRTDIGLSDKGREQAIETANNILALGIKADEIRYSPLSRAKETALTISRITGIPAVEEPRLIEQNFGHFEGMKWETEGFFESKKEMADRYDGGESMLQLAHRIYGLLDDLKASDKTYILVAHNGIVRSVNSYFYSISNEEYARFGVKNCSVTEFEW